MSRIRQYATLIDNLTAMAEGNIGALTVMTRLYKEGDSIDADSPAGGLGAIMNLDHIGIYGSAVWVLYKDVCKESIVKTIAVLRAAQLDLVPAETVKHAAEGEVGLDTDVILCEVKSRLRWFDYHGDDSPLPAVPCG